MQQARGNRAVGVVLTVSEAKRLIAKGVAALPAVREHMTDGMMVIAKGSTNAYVVEELFGKEIDLMSYKSGALTPAQPDTDPLSGQHEAMNDIVLENGNIRKDLDRFSAAEHFNPGDVYIKGANALDYANRKAGILIGAPNGGTIGSVIGHLVGKRAQLLLPVGLEKRVYGDIDMLHRKLQSPHSETWRLFPVSGTLITEIEALELLTGVTATLAAAGGIAGAEGCTALFVEGNTQAVAKALELVASVQGEPRVLNRV